MSSIQEFVHLHVHTFASLGDGVSDPKDLAKKAAEDGMRAFAVTDHGNCNNIWNAAKAASEHGVRLIPGCEAYIVPDAVECRGAAWGMGKAGHLVLLAGSNTGWKNLMKLVALSNMQGYYYGQPRIGMNWLAEHCEDVWATTACLGSNVAKAWRKGHSPDLVVAQLHDIFKERLSLEIQVNSWEDQAGYNDELIRISDSMDIPLVAALDSHYTNKEDWNKQDLISAVQRGRALNDPKRYRMEVGANSFETQAEATKRFGDAYGELGLAAMRRTVEVAEACTVEVEYMSKDFSIPDLPLKERSDYDEFLEWRDKKEGLILM